MRFVVAGLMFMCMVGACASSGGQVLVLDTFGPGMNSSATDAQSGGHEFSYPEFNITSSVDRITDVTAEYFTESGTGNGAEEAGFRAESGRLYLTVPQQTMDALPPQHTETELELSRDLSSRLAASYTAPSLRYGAHPLTEQQREHEVGQQESYPDSGPQSLTGSGLPGSEPNGEPGDGFGDVFEIQRESGGPATVKSLVGPGSGTPEPGPLSLCFAAAIPGAILMFRRLSRR